MSLHYYTKVWDDASLTKRSELLVMLAIADNANKDYHIAWPSIDCIAKKSRCSQRTVQDTVAALQKSGHLAVEYAASESFSHVYLLYPNEAKHPITYWMKKAYKQLGGGARIAGGATARESSANPARKLRAQLHPNRKEQERSHKEKEGTPKMRGVSKSQFPDIPDSLKTPEFETAWAEWLSERKQRRHPVTPTAARKQFAMLDSLGPSLAIEAINRSIMNGWTGLFPPVLNGSPRTAADDRNGFDPNIHSHANGF